jgi:hypothetical protein
MSKRRYSDDFYTELDALIRLQSEKSSKKIEVMEIVQSGDKSDNVTVPVITEPVYKDSRSLWKMVKTNRLLLYIVIFVAFFSLSAIGGIYAVNRQQQANKLIQQKKMNPELSGKTVAIKNKTINYSENITIKQVTVKPVPESWTPPVGGSSKTVLDPKERLKSVPAESYKPDATAVEMMSAPGMTPVPGASETPIPSFSPIPSPTLTPVIP